MNTNEKLLQVPLQVAHVSTENSKQVLFTKLGVDGYFPHISYETEDLAQEVVNSFNKQQGVIKQQQVAHLTGSMFGWSVPGANPNNYDEKGVFIKNK